MKLLFATRADNNIKDMTDITFPYIKDYAEKCGADFLAMSQEPPIWTTEDPPRPHYRIMELYNLFEEYDRIVSIDADTVINKNCPNIFDEVPYDKVGIIYEDVGPSASHRRSMIKLAKEQFGDIDWETGYINIGFSVFSKIHRDIFQPINGEYFMEFGMADVHLCYNIHKMGFQIHQLDHKWNHMTMFSQPWNNNADRFASNIIHYAGEGVFDKPSVSNRVQQIKNDIQRIYGVNE